MAQITFKARFVEPIREGRKVSTIRSRDRRIAVDERLHLFTGSRFKREKIGVALAVWVSPVTLHFDKRLVVIPGRQFERGRGLNEFVAGEGFDSFEELETFFNGLYALPGQRLRSYEGTLIKWGDTFRPEETAP